MISASNRAVGVQPTARVSSPRIFVVPGRPSKTLNQ